MSLVQSDWARAAFALSVALGTAAVVVTRADGASRGTAVEPVPVVYSILNMTERMADRQACPLDLGAARETIERGLSDPAIALEYSPLADGPEVLLHEMSARPIEQADAQALCRWTIRVSYQGETVVHEVHTPPHQPPHSPAYPHLRAASPIAAPAR